MVHYFDNAATTPMRDVAVEAMMPLLQTNFGNPSGAHRIARAANRVVDESREKLAEAIGVEPGELIFTSGGTEADNTIIRGAVEAATKRSAEQPPLAICSAVEHHAILEPVLRVGGRVIGVDKFGQLDIAELETVLSESESAPAVVSVMTANNETGVIQPLDAVVETVRRLAPETLIHTDAVQAMCWLDVIDICTNVDAFSLSAHKFGGPKGVGVLAVRRPADKRRGKVNPLFLGGSQERSRRGGTHNVPGIAGMAAAAAATVSERADAVTRVTELRDYLTDSVMQSIDGVYESGVIADPSNSTNPDRSHKTANICHLSFEGIESEALLFLLEKNGVMASAAASCSSGATESSHVLTAMGYDRALAFGALRLSLGYTTTKQDVDAVLAVLPAAVERLRTKI